MISTVSRNFRVGLCGRLRLGHMFCKLISDGSPHLLYFFHPAILNTEGKSEAYSLYQQRPSCLENLVGRYAIQYLYP